MSGPPRTPTAILESRGSWLAKTRPNEPQPNGELPPPPRWLDKRARRVYMSKGRQLLGMNVGKRIDGAALCRYARYWVLWRQADKVLATRGQTMEITTKQGSYEKARPEVSMVVKYAAILDKLDQQFGFTPAARTRLTTNAPTTEKKAKDRFFAKIG